MGEFHGMLQRLAHWDFTMGITWDCFGLQHWGSPWHSSKASSLGIHYGHSIALSWASALGVPWHASMVSSLGIHYGHSMVLH